MYTKCSDKKATNQVHIVALRFRRVHAVRLSPQSGLTGAPVDRRQSQCNQLAVVWLYHTKSLHPPSRPPAFVPFQSLRQEHLELVGAVGPFVLCTKRRLSNRGKGGWVSGSRRALNAGRAPEVTAGDLGPTRENPWSRPHQPSDILERPVDGLDVVTAGWPSPYCCRHAPRAGYVVHNSNAFVVWHRRFSSGVFHLRVRELDRWTLSLQNLKDHPGFPLQKGGVTMRGP